MKISTLGLMVSVLVIAACSKTQDTDPAAMEEAKIRLGKQLFFDARLSNPEGMACASCHSPAHGFSDPNQELPVSRGIHPDRFTPRNAPSLSYAAFAPDFHFDPLEKLYVGGFFLDGRAVNMPAQVTGPMLSAVEMANESPEAIIAKVAAIEEYRQEFERLYGKDILSRDEAIHSLEDAIVHYERSTELSPFNSKYDYYLAGKLELSEAEMRGLKVFESEDKGNCAACHPSSMGEDKSPPLFTDYTYDNIGVPANADNPFYGLAKQFNPKGQKFVDRGLGVTTNDPKQDGKFKVPTLRNIALSAPYMHNGVFKTLEEVISFYNTRDTDKKHGKPEVAANVNEDELGDLKLSEQEEADLLAFLKTLSDGYQLPSAK